MKAIVIIILVAVAIIVSLFLGKLLPMHLPLMSKLLDRKPFSCRPCSTFHLLWMQIAVVAFAVDSLLLFAVGWALAFIVFGIVRHIDNKKIVK